MTGVPHKCDVEQSERRFPLTVTIAGWLWLLVAAALAATFVQLARSWFPLNWQALGAMGAFGLAFLILLLCGSLTFLAAFVAFAVIGVRTVTGRLRRLLIPAAGSMGLGVVGLVGVATVPPREFGYLELGFIANSTLLITAGISALLGRDGYAEWRRRGDGSSTRVRPIP